MTARPSLPPCDVLLMTVTDVETRTLLDLAEERTGQEAKPVHGEDRTYNDLGTLGGARLMAARSEMGAISVGGAATTSLLVFKELRPAAVIMVGIAFGVDEEKQPIGQVLVSRQIQPYDLQRVGEDRILRGDRATADPTLLSRFHGSVRSWSGSAAPRTG